MKWRGLFRIHLSTAVVMMFVAGGLLALNFRARSRTLIQFFPGLMSGESRVGPYDFDRYEEIIFGWPADCKTHKNVLHLAEEAAFAHGTIISRDSTLLTLMDLEDVRKTWPNVYQLLQELESQRKRNPSDEAVIASRREHVMFYSAPSEPWPHHYEYWNSTDAQINVAVACAIMAIVVITSEWLIRHREARRT
jgi:hypothetical protein